MCNLKQTPQSNWWSNDSSSLCDTTGLGMVLWPQQPPERGVETSRSLPRRGMLQYLPLLHDKLPVALESRQLKPLLHGQRPVLPISPRLSHLEPAQGEDGGCLLLQQRLAHTAGSAVGKRCWDASSHHLSANRVGTSMQEPPSRAPSEGVVASILCRETTSPSWSQTDGKEPSKG